MGLSQLTTRHYRVKSRNGVDADNNHVYGPYSRVQSATTEAMPARSECTGRGVVWSAYVTVRTFGVFDYQGFKRGVTCGTEEDGTDDELCKHEISAVVEGQTDADKLSLGSTEYTVNELYYGRSYTMPSRHGRQYHEPDYHFAISPAPDYDPTSLSDGSYRPEGVGWEDLTLYVGGTALPFSFPGTIFSRQSFGGAFRWAGSQYEGTFDYQDGDSIMVCLIDAAPDLALVLNPYSISENGGVSTVTASVTEGSAAPFQVSVSTEPAAGDFSLSANTTLSFAANATRSSGTVTITARDNDVDAEDKTDHRQGSRVGRCADQGAEPRDADDRRR